MAAEIQGITVKLLYTKAVPTLFATLVMVTRNYYKLCNLLCHFWCHVVNNRLNNSYNLIADVWLADFDLFLIPSPGNNKYLHETQKVSMVLQCLKVTNFNHINLPEEELICFL